VGGDVRTGGGHAEAVAHHVVEHLCFRHVVVVFHLGFGVGVMAEVEVVPCHVL
jgi:hypothetical protein